MNGQLDLFSNELTEQDVYEILLPSLIEYLSQINGDETLINSEITKSYTSVHFLKPDAYDPAQPLKEILAFRICCRKNHHYFGVSNLYTRCATPPITECITTDGRNKGFTNYEFTPSYEGIMKFAPFLTSVFEMVIDSIIKEFDCCSRYAECSNLKRCLNPSPGIATHCGYRRIMKQDIYFYGKNRNVQ